MNYVVAIPSYERADVLGAKTLATLDRLDVDRDLVHVFVANDEQAEKYRAALDVRVTVAVPGVFACRRWYTEHFPDGTRILNFDDDVTELRHLDGERLVPWPGTVDALAAMGFGLCEQRRLRLFGITAVDNAFFCHEQAVVGLRYVCGIVHGSYAGDPVMLDPQREVVSSGEDYETSIRSYVRYGGVVRLDWLAPKTKYFAPGGIQAELGGRDEREVHHAEYLRRIAADHPEFARVVRKGTGINLRLKVLTSERISRSSVEADFVT